MKIHPITDHILVRRKDPEKVSPGGIHIPTVAQDKPQYATVVEVGPGKHNDKGVFVPMRLEAGDVVYLSKWVGTRVEIDGIKHLVLEEGDVLGRVV